MAGWIVGLHVEKTVGRSPVGPEAASWEEVPAELLFLPPSSTGDPSPGSSMIWTHSRGLASLPMQLNTPARPGDSKEQDTEEPKKRKGGWPKGKKRKPPRDLSVPRAPTTGYVIFLNEQRSQLRAKHPNLPFTEITKILAAQWAQLSQERKQRYIYAADEDKQRYIRELQAYQSSEAYRAFLRRRAAHRALCGPGAPGGELEREDLDLSAMNASEDGDLRCRTCHQCFSSQHNKREHLLGRQHLHNLTGEFEKDSAKYLRHLEPPQEEEGRMHKTESEEEAEGPGAIGPGALAPGETFASLDLSFWQEFFWKLLKVKEFELGELRSTLGRAQAEQEALQRQLAEFQSQQQRLEVELAGLRTCGLVLEKELENLNMLLLLSCFSLQMADTA
ncbi:SWI/SNF-related matrix-associated actin-dependent regulator of chromatin subfamily E member 1-related [Fukomys damarensis]|uniref:SWI/SNF-related matrix-associated actin-dependent regulator of chromatin subfamily E member 1-related n=1 Tax=Fukomys damarensis TaxID=885580 RepID=UPI00053FB532|nr:SWI/SNF-related matrix-associated actin-dependent regulator of chromatin subfamily E member 1-related [Fukomys damarensis]